MGNRVKRLSGDGFIHIANLLLWEPQEVVQVGIGTNFQEMVALKEEWPTVEIFGVEPNPELDLAEYPGQVLRAAIDETPGSKDFFVKPRHASGSSFIPIEGVTPISVPTVTLDSLGPWETKSRLLWLDCEGSELRALNGASDLLKKVSMINIEMTSSCPPAWGQPTEIHTKLNQLGFLRQWQHTHRSHVGQVDVVYVRRNLFQPQLCCCPCQVELFQRSTAGESFNRNFGEAK